METWNSDDYKATCLQGDCLEVMAMLPDNSVDSIVTDPPYGLSFMGKKWDYDVPSEAIWREALRVLKPGGHLLAFAGTRTQHRMAVRIEDAGFEIRDMIAWVYGSGFPKSLDVSKAIDKAAGAERDVLGVVESRKRPNLEGVKSIEGGWDKSDNGATITAPATPEARQWNGWGTALKPAHEPVGIYYKPLTIETVCAILLADVTEQIWRELCQRSNVNASDAESLLNGIRVTLEKAAALSVAENVRISVLEKPESAILAALSSTLQKHTETVKGTTKDGSAQGSANPNGNENATQEPEIQVGRAEGTSTVDMFISAITDHTSENIALCWSNTLAATLSLANTFTTRTALRLTIELRTLRSLMQASILQSTGSSSSYSPALEPITVARKPFPGTVAANVLEHGTGAINVDGCRVGTEATVTVRNGNSGAHGRYGKDDRVFSRENPPGRWPANLIHDGSDEALGLFPVTGASRQVVGKRTGKEPGRLGAFSGQDVAVMGHDDNGGSAARFFYCAKASKRDRDEGMDDAEDRVLARSCQAQSEAARGNAHPTVKPTDLMRYLCRLVTPPGGTVLDCFMGSGSTGKAAMLEGFEFIGIERDADSFATSVVRINHAKNSFKNN